MLNLQFMQLNNLIKTVIQELKNCQKLKYTGELNIKNEQGRNWKFYYQHGQVIWATGSQHTHRRYRR
ncbi:MAG: response regulator, partial [Sphaerospermopsis sp. SIO1G2]|nr:response regulator [Sphaerospermopsis sp. SIO1G2]